MKKLYIPVLAVALLALGVFGLSPVAKADLPECTLGVNPNLSIPPGYSFECQPYDLPGGVHLNAIKLP